MTNVSKSGAYIISEQEVVPGDFLRVAMKLKRVAKEYKIDGRVVWSVSGNSLGIPTGFGVRFLSFDEVYRWLLRESREIIRIEDR